jgi:flagellar hook-associated protein 2
VSTSVTSAYSYSSSNRITGLVSGLDVDSIVEQLMEAEKQPLYKLEQQLQLATWKQDAYREIISQLTAFSDTYFDYANSTSNMLSQTSYIKYSTSSSDDSIVTVSTTSDVEAGTHTVEVENLATKAIYESVSVTETITGLSAADFSEAAGKTFVLTIDGTSKTITISNSVTDISGLQTAIDNAVGSGKIEVSDTNGDGTGYLTLSKVEDSGIGTIALSEGSGTSALSDLGFSDDDQLTNYLDTSETLETIANRLGETFSFDEDGNINLTINEVDFSFSQSTSLEEMMEEINDSDAGVTMKYSETSDTFTIIANETGAANGIVMSETDSTFLQAAKLTNYTAGEDAVAIIDGEKVTRSSNTITLDGVTYELTAESSEEQTVTVSLDADGIYDQIKTFVDDYNSLIESINEIISEEYDRDYPPLTDDQKSEMSEDEISQWEEKAKTGLLERDGTLKSMLSNMRSALYQSVSGVSTHLTKIGITTSSNYQDKGRLVIDEEKLKEAIEADPEEVSNLFCQQSESYPGTTTVCNLTVDQRNIRTSEEGLAYKLYDILQDNISTYTGIDGKKGELVEKAGLEGDGSEYSNTISKKIEKYNDEIDAMAERLDQKEEYYYDKYSLVETYLNQMNTQINVLQSYLA